MATPDRTPPPPARTQGRRRGLWLLVGLVGVVLAGLIAFWVISLDDPDDSSNAQSPTPASTSAAPTEEEPEPPADPTADETSETSAEATTEAPTDPLSASNITTFLEDYHEQVLSDPRGAYARTGPTLRAAIGSEDAYVRYWGQFSDVRISDIQAADGRNTALATLELRYANGTSESGPHQFTFLVQDGQLILDSDYPA